MSLARLVIIDLQQPIVHFCHFLLNLIILLLPQTPELFL